MEPEDWRRVRSAALVVVVAAAVVLVAVVILGRSGISCPGGRFTLPRFCPAAAWALTLLLFAPVVGLIAGGVAALAHWKMDEG